MGQFRRLISHQLCRMPQVYLMLLRWRGRSSLEKLVFLASLRTGDTVWDIGANTGHYTLLFSDIVGRSGKVHAFEPVPGTFAQLEARIRSDGRYGNVCLHQVACTERNGEVTLYLPGNDTGQASLTDRHHDGSWRAPKSVRPYQCRGIALDSYDALNTGAAPTFVKCDVEGAEMLVLRGARNLVARHRPLLFLEVSSMWARAFGYGPSDMNGFLRELGYDYFLTCGEKLPLLPWENSLGEDEQVRTETINVIAAIQGRHRDQISYIRRLSY